MIHLEIKGKLKTSIEKLKTALREKMHHDPRLSVDGTRELNLKGYISIGGGDNFCVSDILRILVKHCSFFKVKFEEHDYFNRSFLFSFSYFIWNGKNLIQHYKDMFGPVDEVENWNWIIDEE